MISQNASIKELDFITQGILTPYPPLNPQYRIEDLEPLIINSKPKIIGEGRFSLVYLYKHKINESFFALKKISIKKILDSGNDINIIQREINIHSRIKHENIVQFYSYNKSQNEVEILLEYCRNGSIFELIDKNGFDENKTYKYFSQVVNAVYFLHKNNLVHRDIKPENILLDGDKIKLCDFGWCCETNNNNRKSFCGTFEYMAPEIINEIPYGKPVDIWAMGILLYELYFGVSPFNSNKENEEKTKEIINNIMQKKLFFNRKSIAYDMKDLIVHMLEFDVNKRYTIEEVVSHPWFKKCKEKAKNIIINNTNQINNYDNIETNVTKVTKIIRNPSEIITTSSPLLYSQRTFGQRKIDSQNNKIYLNKSNYYSDKALHFKHIKYNSINNIDNNNNEEEDGFSPFMKNGSININVSLKNNYNEINNQNLKRNNLPLNKNYSNSTRKIFKTKSQLDTNALKNIQFFPMDNISDEYSFKRKIEPKKFSNNLNPKRISIVKLDNKKIDPIPKDTNNVNNNIYNSQNMPKVFYKGNNINQNIINYNFYQINNNNQFNNIFY